MGVRHRSHVLAFAVLLLTLGIPPTAVGQAPIPSGPDAPTRGPYWKQVIAEQSRLVEEYEKRTQDPPELRATAQKILLATKQSDLGLRIELSREEVNETAADLMSKGCKDPLVATVAAVTSPNLAKKDELKSLCDQAIKDVVGMYEPQEQVDVIMWCQRIQLRLYNTYRRERSKFQAPDRGLLSDAYIRWMIASDELEQQRRIWTMMERYYLNLTAYRGHELVDLAKKSRTEKLHPWMRHMLDAHVAFYDGRELELSDDDNYKTFYREAAKEYEAAWELAPQFPEAAAELIRLARGGHIDGTPRDWFDRAIAAEIDNPRAYTYYRTHLRTEGADALVDFGAECAATRRYDTGVPFELLESLWAVENHTGENVWARDGVYEMVRELCQNAVKAPTYKGEPQSDASRAWMAATQIVIAGRASRFEDIAPLWERTDEANLQRAVRTFRLKMPLATLKASADAAAGGIFKLVSEIEKALAVVRDEETALAAEKKIKAAASELKPGDPRLTQWRAALDFFKQFYTGDWANVTFPQGCLDLADAPKWCRAGDRALVTRGTYRFRLPYLAKLPAPFEVSVEISTVEMPPDVIVAGVLLGDEGPAPNQISHGALFGVNSGTGKAAIYRGVPAYYKASLSGTSTVHLRAWHGYREFFVNGERLASWAAYDFDPTGDFILWTPGPENSTPIVRFSNLRVRAIPHDSPPPRTEHAGRVEYFTARIAEDAENVWNYLDRGNAYLAAGEAAKAIGDFEHLLKLRPNWDYAVLRMGMARAANGEYQQAIDRYQQVLELAPNATHALERWAWLEATCRDERFRNGAESLERINQAIELSGGKSRGYYLTLAAAHAELADFEAARAALKKAGSLLGQEEKALLEPMKKALDENKPFRAD